MCEILFILISWYEHDEFSAKAQRRTGHQVLNGYRREQLLYRAVISQKSCTFVHGNLREPPQCHHCQEIRPYEPILLDFRDWCYLLPCYTMLNLATFLLVPVRSSDMRFQYPMSKLDCRVRKWKAWGKRRIPLLRGPCFLLKSMLCFCFHPTGDR